MFKLNLSSLAIGLLEGQNLSQVVNVIKFHISVPKVYWQRIVREESLILILTVNKV